MFSTKIKSENQEFENQEFENQEFEKIKNITEDIITDTSNSSGSDSDNNSESSFINNVNYDNKIEENDSYSDFINSEICEHYQFYHEFIDSLVELINNNEDLIQGHRYFVYLAFESFLDKGYVYEDYEGIELYKYVLKVCMNMTLCEFGNLPSYEILYDYWQYHEHHIVSSKTTNCTIL